MKLFVPYLLTQIRTFKLKSYHKILILISLIFFSQKNYSQHLSQMTIVLADDAKTISVNQEITFFNQSNNELDFIILNDWNNAYSSKTSLLAERFSDEFIRSFHLAPEKDRGNTSNIIFLDENKNPLTWSRFENKSDLIQVNFPNKIEANQKIKFQISYQVKIPNARFTKYGFTEKGELILKDWFLSPAKYDNNSFVTYSNANIDDIANAISDYEINVTLPQNLEITSDLNMDQNTNNNYLFSGKNRNTFSLFIQPKSDFYSFKNKDVEVLTNLKDKKLNDIQKAIIVDKIINFTTENLGKFPFEKITISQEDYDRNPFYGLNQLPSFMSPFSNEFLFELKFLKTYINNYLHNSLHLDPRKDNWVYDGFQVYFMLKYLDEYYPDSKMMGNVAKLKILKSFKIFNLDFNEQYSYFYMLMARKNLDQPIGDPKNTFIKFNEKIAGKYRAGLSLKYLDNYLEKNIVSKSIQEFINYNVGKETTSLDFEKIIKKNASKKIDWFFETIIYSRKIIDFKFTDISKTKDSVTFTIKNKTQTNVPISVYGLKNKKIVFKKWLENIQTDSTFTLERVNADKIVINYKNEVPEFNERNNWKSLSGFFPNHRPVKFVFMKDIEDPYYNQILYVPAFNYNLYDGLTAGMRFHNKTLLDKPFNFDFEPSYASRTKSLIGAFSFGVNKYNRDSNLYNTRFGLSGSISHYAPDARYMKFTPYLSFNFRQDDFRNNQKQSLSFRYVTVNREKTAFVTNKDTENYSVFDARFGSNNTRITKQFRFSNNLQLAQKFGKLSGNIEYRKLFENNRQLNLRFYAGTFLYRNTSSNFFSFALDRPTDYLFDYNYIGRSESTGIFSQQIIIAEGGFKTKVTNAFANQWITAANGSINIWNWIEVYGDVSLYKNQSFKPKFVFDSGIRLNLVTDYFELYFPVYSSNGWDLSKNNYNEKIRFIVTLSTGTLTGLFTRKWF